MVWTLATIMLSAQSAPGPAHSFEVASVHPSPPDHGYTSLSPEGAAQFSAKNASMMLLIGYAFGISGKQIKSAPDWFESTFYDVAAKPEGDVALTYEQSKPLLQQLLKQRFGLVVHHEMQDVPGYALVVAKGGPKLKEAKGAPANVYILSNGLQGSSIPISVLASMLAYPLGEPVVDKTGLKGNYDIKLSFIAEGSPEAATSELPSIFTAVQEQVGLKLDSQKVSQDFLVIDHAEKVPTEN